MDNLLQVQIAVDEESARRFGEEYERSIRRNAYSALADKMLEDRSATERIIDPKSEGAPDYERHLMRRYYRFSVLVGESNQAEEIVKARAKGFSDALDALREMLKRPDDYQGEIRSYFLRWLGPITPEFLEHFFAAMQDK